MKFSEKLQKDFEAGCFSNGLKLKIHYSTSGNTYNYLLGDELYKSFHQCSRTLTEFECFIKVHDIKVTEIGKKGPFWNDNYRTENRFEPTEKAPSFKSKW